MSKFELSEFVLISDSKSKKKSPYSEIEESPMTQIPLDRFPGLVELRIVNSPNITNGIFGVIAKNGPLLTTLEFGGKAEEYNTNISLDGIRVLCGSMDEEKDEYWDEYSEEDEGHHESMGLQSNL